jgi:hypothetical protein
MKKILPLLFLASCAASDKDSAESLLTFVPPSYSLNDTLRADLNGDGELDLLMILEGDSSNPEVGRRLLKLLTSDKRKYKEEWTNGNSIYCRFCNGEEGDPFQGIKIEGQTVRIEHFGGPNQKWARTTSFTYMNEDWYVIEDALVHMDENGEIQTKIMTPKDFGEVKMKEFNLD